jgi:hypothetical protein
MKKSFTIFVAMVLVAGCTLPPPHVFLVTPEMLAERQIETRRYDGIKEEDLLSACANVLQDMGFQLENSESRLGVLTVSKQRNARDTGEIVLKLIIGILSFQPPPPYSRDQSIRASLIVRPVTDVNGKALPDSHYVRITVQRLVRRTDNSTYVETLRDPKLYEGFFEKLSKSMFIEAQKI